jgi:hypothetical protein
MYLLCMGLDFKQIWKTSRTLADLVKEESGDKVITRTKIKSIATSDHFGQVLLSAATTLSDKIKIIQTTWFIINKPNYTPEKIYKIINDFYILVVDFYVEQTTKTITCDECDYGYVDCNNCDGSGKQDCRYCDGEGTLECDTCYGEGTQDCRYCDGKGTETETEEDDEGEEVEVEVACVHCDGGGKESCRDCGGQGNFECDTCDSTGTEECGECLGSGSDYCGECGGSGDVESYESYYSIERTFMVVNGDSMQKYIDKPLTKDAFDDIEGEDPAFDFYMILKRQDYMSDNTVEDERENNEMEDDFVIVQDLIKLEDSNLRVHVLY